MLIVPYSIIFKFTVIPSDAQTRSGEFYEI